MHQSSWKQFGRISIDWELYQEKAVKFKEYVNIVLTSFILFICYFS